MYVRAYSFMAKGLLSKDHPILAHIIPMRRCNLSCTYCNEYDDYSKPVPSEEMFRAAGQACGSGHHGNHYQRR